MNVDHEGVWKSANGKGQSPNNNPFAYELRFVEAENFAERIDDLNAGSDHLDIKENKKWRKLYNAGLRDFPFMDTLGQVTSQEILTVPCHNCGCVVPWSSVQVDHYMPQAGSASLWAHKTLRALGLTVGSASGGKGSNQSSLHRIVLNPKGRAMGDYSHFGNSTDAAKWTTTEKGDAFLSLIAHAGWIDGLNKACMNSFLNLSPLCRACNGKKSDQVKAIE
ncbi:MAG TPA: hypothetical protein VGL08_17775 [Paraburkholderia sp.]